MGTSMASIARSLLSTICTGQAAEVHVCFDKYGTNSIKDGERTLRGAQDTAYNITGPEQILRQSGQRMLSNGIFKNELAKFLLEEWGKDHYWNFFNRKLLFASYGGDCCQYVADEESRSVCVTKPLHLQGDHEEADTLIAFHAKSAAAGYITVRASDTDVLVILIGTLGNQRVEVRSMTKIVMDCGQGNKRRNINVSNIADILDERRSGLAAALVGYHAFTGCDFTSAFFR